MGVWLLFCKNYLNSEILNKISSATPNLKKLLVKVKIGSRKFLISSLYRPPNRASLGFDVEFETLLQTIDLNYRGYTVILGGDLNFDL